MKHVCGDYFNPNFLQCMLPVQYIEFHIVWNCTLTGSGRLHINRKALHAIRNHSATTLRWLWLCNSHPITRTGDQHHFAYFPAMHSLMKITAHGCATSNRGLSERIIYARHL